MIPLREQEFIRELFEERLTGPVKLELFTQRPAPVFIPGREDCRFCDEVEQMLEDLSRLSAKISLRVHDWVKSTEEAKKYGVERVPATVVRGVLNRPVRFYGLPGGALFPVLVEAFIAVSEGTSGSAPTLKRKLKRIKRDLSVLLFVALEDPAGADLARLLTGIALESAHIQLSIIEIEEFPALAQQHKVEHVPLTVIDNRARLSGSLSADQVLDQLVKAVETTVTTGPTRLPGGGVALDVPNSADVQRGETRPSGLIVPRR